MLNREELFFYLLKFIIILAVAGAGFFCGEKVWASVLINEVQIYPTGNRFIELYNASSLPVDLTGWSVKKKTASGVEYSLLTSSRFKGKIILPQNYFLLTNEEGYSGNITPDALWAKSNTFAKDNTIIFYDNNQSVADKVGFGLTADCEGDRGNCALNPDENHSIQRNAFVDTNNNRMDFLIQNNPNPQNSAVVITPPPTAQCGNGQVESGEQCDDSNLVSGDGCSSTCQAESENPPNPLNQEGETASSTGQNTIINNPPNPLYQGGKNQGGTNKLGDVVINELVSDPADNEVEWVEIFNKSGQEIDLTGWRLEEGGKAKTNLSGIIGASGAGLYKIIEKPSGSLNNAGDAIVLFDAGGKIIDQAAYGNWNDGNLADNAPVTPDPASLARKFNGYNTFNNLNDFAATLKPTKGASNIIEAEDEASAEAKAKFDYSSDIYLSEILPNPAGDDAKSEYIEIHNAGKREVNLIGWSLSREDDKKVNFENIATGTIIKAGEYLTFFRPRTKIVLHNDQGKIKLFQPLADKPIMSVDYKNVKEGWSYNITSLYPPLSGGNWEWSETITPGAINIFKIINHAPEAEFSFKSPALAGVPVVFDSSDTDDADGDKLKFSWDFSDGFKNNLANPEHTYLKAGIYIVKLAVSDGQATSTKEKSIKVLNSINELRVGEGINSENPPSPLYQGGTIIINEIYPNPDGADTGQEWLEIKNQSAEQIDLLNWRVENSNGKYKFTGAQPLRAGAFYVLDNVKSKLALKNISDIISLYNDLDELADKVEYVEAAQGEAYARGANGSWFWTTVRTVGKENVIKVAESEISKNYKVAGVKINADEYIETDLEKIRGMEIGSLVRVKGTAAVSPGILGVQVFYIVGSPGMQIYNYKKDFPALKVGDYVEVAGELAQTQGEFRIKTKEKNDIKIIGHKDPPAALNIKADEVSEENIGQLISITGEITDKKSASLYVDDGSGEIFVYIKQAAGIDTKSLAAGQKASVIGILSKTQTGFRLLPRFQADIVLINSAVGADPEPQVLGEVALSREWDLAERDKKLELFKYLLIIAGGLIIILGILFIKNIRKN